MTVFHRPDTDYVDGLKIKKYVYSHISFNLPEHIYDQVDSIMAEFWESTDHGCCIFAEDFEEQLCKLVNYDIILGNTHIRCLSSLIMEALQAHGYIEKHS